jgi:hypothetical protein
LHDASVPAAPIATGTDFGPLDLNEMSDVVSQMKGREPDESTLIRYLVGRASEEEADQLDELSVASEEFALRLRAVEHDLVDAYVNGELTGETLEGFKSQYLRTPSGLEAVALAEALRGYPRTQAAAPAADRATAPSADRVAAPAAADRAAAPDVRARSRSWPAWGLAAAALVLAASAYLLMDDLRLRRQISGARETHAALEQRAQQLQEELNRQQSVARANEQELARAREALAAASDRSGSGATASDEPRTGGVLLALVLSAARRGADQLPQFTIPPGAGTVILRLPLVAVDFPHYEAALRDAASDRVIWRSGRLPAPAVREQPMIPVTVRTSLLGPRAYALELTGISARGQAEPLDSYLFRVVP